MNCPDPHDYKTFWSFLGARLKWHIFYRKRGEAIPLPREVPLSDPNAPPCQKCGEPTTHIGMAGVVSGWYFCLKCTK